MKRPTFITVICWIIIVTSIISGLMMIPMLLSHPAPEVIAQMEAMSRLTFQQSIAYSMGIIALKLVAAILMLKGRNQGRQLYVGSGLLGLAVAAATSRVILAILPGTVVFAVIVFFLYRPKVNAYFAAPVVAE